MPVALLKPGEADRVVAGHPWIYAGSIKRLTSEVAPGDAVLVKDHRQRLLGTGFINPDSKVRIRLLSRDREDLDAVDFFERRFQDALSWRRRRGGNQSSFRWINAESDFLSGLIVDVYEGHWVIQISSLGMERRRNRILEALKRVMKPASIIERRDHAGRRYEGLPVESEANVMEGSAGCIEAKINDLSFGVDLSGGHKTGFYLDQQDNYRKVARFGKGGRVLDCFSFQGGFAIHAAKEGAASVVGLDQSGEAVVTATKNAEMNGVQATCRFEETNVFDWLKEATRVPKNEKLIPSYDLIILDPPSFTRSRATVRDALRGYKEIHLRALKLLRTGGVLATFCCSHHVDKELFMDVILASAYDAKRTLRLIEPYAQSLDHPILPAVPETEYLKGFAFEVC